MSFSKAKIIRFNDVSKPSSSSKELPKTKRSTFSPNSDVNSVKSVPLTFRTPTLPKKAKTATSSTKIKPKELFNDDLKALLEKTTECENKTKYIHQLTKELDDLKEELHKVKKEKEQLQIEQQKEIDDLEFEMLKTMNELHRQEQEAAIKIQNLEQKLGNEINNLKKAHEYHIGQVVLDCEIKLKDIREATEQTLHNKVRDLEESWTKKLQNQEAEAEQILKECQAITEFNIIQCELEKKAVEKNLEDLTCEHNFLRKKYKDLSQKLSEVNEISQDVEKKLESQIETLTITIIKKEEEIIKLNSEIKTYQLTINNTQTAIDVLKNRLIHSDQDVEHLKEDLTRCEKELLTYENKCYQLQSDLKDAKDYNDELELQFEAAFKVNEDILNNIKNELLRKVEFYEEQVKKFTKKEAQERNMKDSIMEELNYNIDIIKKISKEVDRTEQMYDSDIQDLKKTIDLCMEKEKGYIMNIDVLSEENLNYKNQIDEKDKKIKSLEQKLSKLTWENEDLRDKYTYYKNKSDEFVIDNCESSQTRKKYIDLSGKYDILLQDFETAEKQNKEYKMELEVMTKKLNALSIIEDKCEKLKKEKILLEVENQSYKNKLEDQKLKKYKYCLQDKENIGSPNRSLIDSPSRGSPFKERN